MYTHTYTHHHQAWKPSSQLYASNDPSLALWVRSMNMSLTSCTHTVHTSAFYIMYLVHSETNSLSALCHLFIIYLFPNPCVYLVACKWCSVAVSWKNLVRQLAGDSSTDARLTGRWKYIICILQIKICANKKNPKTSDNCWTEHTEYEAGVCHKNLTKLMWCAHLNQHLQNTRHRHDRAVDFTDGKEGGERESNNIKPAGGNDKGFF